MPTTRKQWYDDPTNRTELLRQLESGPLKAAIEILVYENLPSFDGRIAPNDAVANAMQNKEREGFFDFLAQLRELTQAEPDPRKDIPKPFEHFARKARKPITPAPEASKA